MPDPKPQDAHQDLIDRLDTLRAAALTCERDEAAALSAIPEAYRASAANLLHYVAVRRFDLRDLQQQLHEMGLSSLGRMEPYVLPTLDAVLHALHRLAGAEHSAGHADTAASTGFANGPEALRRHADELLGERSGARQTRLMVTAADEAASRYEHVRALIEAGTDVLRINCAKGDRKQWQAMTDHVRRAEREVGRSCRVACDLGGPNPRTVELPTGPASVKWKPAKDAGGVVSHPASIWLGPRGIEPRSADAALPIEPTSLLERAEPGDRLVLEPDDGGARLELRIVETETNGAWAEAGEAAEIVEGTSVVLLRDGQELDRGRAGKLPAPDTYLRLSVGDELLLTRADVPGGPAERNEQGEVVRAARIGCDMGAVLRDVQVGHPILFDDGRLAGVVRDVDEDEGLTVEITAARKGRTKLKPLKGINLPETDLDVPSLTDDDLAALDFVVENADLVGLSFVREPEDVDRLVEELEARDSGRHLGIVLKIETARAFEALPHILLTALRHPPVGVMVARGDLGVEIGFERMAEVQEEILWLCEAAHVPVIWATQVLESIAKKGVPVRGEITDAAMSSRAECVMLNKGWNILGTLEALDDILGRMREHQRKKHSLLRPLSISRGF